MTEPAVNLPLFNIALRPTDERVGDRFVEAAQPYAATQEDYILGKGKGLPHVTLTFFRAENAEAACKVFESWKEAGDVAVTLGDVTNTPHLSSPGVVWTAISVAREEWLMKLQKSCRAHLEAQGYSPLTPADTYDPHFTLARRRAEPEVAPPNPPGLENGRLVLCRASVGEATEMGMFMRAVSDMQNNKYRVTPLETPRL